MSLARCSLKVSLPGTDAYDEYDRLFISGAPRDLPDGTYTLTFAGRVFSAQWRIGAWTLQSRGSLRVSS